MSKLVIFGTGSFAECADYLFTDDSSYDVVGFTATGDHISDDKFRGKSLVPFERLEQHYPPDEVDLFIAVGYRKLNRFRARIYDEAKQRGYRLATYVSSRTTYLGEAIGDNCFVFEDNTIQPFVRIGNNVVMWSGNHVGHHTQIGDHCFVTSHVVISGHVKVGPWSFLGVNATVRDAITIGESCIIGANALIMKSTADREVYVPRRTKPDERTSDEIDL